MQDTISKAVAGLVATTISALFTSFQAYEFRDCPVTSKGRASCLGMHLRRGAGHRPEWRRRLPAAPPCRRRIPPSPPRLRAMIESYLALDQRRLVGDILQSWHGDPQLSAAPDGTGWTA